jgi:hypothetical protein
VIREKGSWLKPCPDAPNSGCYIKERCNATSIPDSATNWFGDEKCRIILPGCVIVGTGSRARRQADDKAVKQCLAVKPCLRPHVSTGGAAAGTEVDESGSTATGTTAGSTIAGVVVGVALLAMVVLFAGYMVAVRTKSSPSSSPAVAVVDSNHPQEVLEWDGDMPMDCQV